MILSRNYTPEELKSISQDEVVPKDELYVVEAILRDNGEPMNRKYLVKWKDYSDEHNNWLDPSDFSDPEMINQYWRRVKRDAKGNIMYHDNGSYKRKPLPSDYTPSRLKQVISKSLHTEANSSRKRQKVALTPQPTKKYSKSLS
ncbi:hypothetical protein G6F68_008045 [Rhizopus microsporus]|nr:hypothetical protein G6F68_008045 [Rhizopus microsporus]